MVRTVSGRLLDAGRIGLLPAAFNPPTVAHVALAEGAQSSFGLNQVVYALPATMPHKHFPRPTLAERMDWLSRIAEGRPDRAVAACAGGLVIEIVEEFRAVLGEACELFVIAGRDAAERFAEWDYGDGMPFAEQLRRYRMLVASRDGDYRVADDHAGRVLPFKIDARLGEASSSAVRDAIRSGGQWSHFVPPAIRQAVGAAYSGAAR